MAWRELLFSTKNCFLTFKIIFPATSSIGDKAVYDWLNFYKSVQFKFTTQNCYIFNVSVTPSCHIVAKTPVCTKYGVNNGTDRIAIALVTEVQNSSNIRTTGSSAGSKLRTESSWWKASGELIMCTSSSKGAQISCGIKLLDQQAS